MITARRAALMVVALLAACGSDGPDAPSSSAVVDEALVVDRAAAVAAAVDIRADGCGPRVGFGSGSVIADRTIVTAAHVVAGADSIEMFATDGSSTTGDVVLFDPDLDLAIIRAASSIGTPLRLRPEKAMVGEAGIVVLPRATADGPVEVDVSDVTVVRPATIRTTDIYLDQPVERTGFEIEGSIDPGDSGAVVVLPGGGTGIVWARSNVDRRRAWAIDVPATLLDGDAVQLTTPVDTGPCIR